MIRPGSIVLIDTQKRTIASRREWTHEFDRPIYFLITRNGYASAGLFDLIEVDLNAARQLREELRSGDPQSEEALYGITLRAARALLITRGIEAPTDAVVFESFVKHFIQAGLIDRRFESVIRSELGR